MAGTPVCTARSRIRTRWRRPSRARFTRSRRNSRWSGRARSQDIRAEVLTPDKLNAVVFGGFAAVALLISVVGVAGVLAFSVSGRTREFGIRMALGAQPRDILTDVLAQGLAIAGIGVGVGVVFGLSSHAGSADM